MLDEWQDVIAAVQARSSEQATRSVAEREPAEDGHSDNVTTLEPTAEDRGSPSIGADPFAATS